MYFLSEIKHTSIGQIGTYGKCNVVNWSTFDSYFAIQFYFLAINFHHGMLHSLYYFFIKAWNAYVLIRTSRNLLMQVINRKVMTESRRSLDKRDVILHNIEVWSWQLHLLLVFINLVSSTDSKFGKIVLFLKLLLQKNNRAQNSD